MNELKSKYTGSDENGKMLLCYSSEQLDKIKQELKLGKLYKEAYILFMDIEYLETGGDRKQLTMTWEKIDKRYGEVKKEIEVIENELKK